ncbi:hypothetical protein [Actinoplanes sp. NPDC051411]|uniref:hypothetical protein n=1 Tax=Actinoplanes sp. NPDC051411 TaxID=3155522 RepID=UPI0034150EBB
MEAERPMADEHASDPADREDKKARRTPPGAKTMRLGAAADPVRPKPAPEVVRLPEADVEPDSPPKPAGGATHAEAGALAAEAQSGPATADTDEDTVVAEPDEAPPGEAPAAARPDQIEPDRDRRRVARPSGLGQAPWILALSSFGVLLVAVGYAGGREQTRLALAAYWIGQIVVFTPVVTRLLTRRLAGVAESFTLVMGLAFNQYLLKWFYSPDQFRFPDELQHWLATTIINQHGRLFQPNLALPPAVHFPGLAEMGAAVSQLTGLPVTAAGLIVAGTCHLGLVAALYVAVLRSSHSPATAGVTCVVYATSLHYLFFNSMYLYQTGALVFLMLTVWASQRFKNGNGWEFGLLAVAGTVLTTVCHHVTAGALVLTLLLIGLVEVVVTRPRPWKNLILPLGATVVVAVWILVVARDVIAYLEAPLDQVTRTAKQFFSGQQQAAGAAAEVPLWELGIQALGLLFLLGLFLAVARDTNARKERDPWQWAALTGSAVFFAGNGVRFLGSNGPEIAGRLSTFTYVPMSVVAATALVQAVRLLPSKKPLKPGRTFTRRVLAGAVVITVLMAGARVGGWPPAGQLLPGPYLADGFERSVDRYGLDAADWERDMLGPGQRTGGDLTAIALASTYGRQDPVRGVGKLFYDEQWSDTDEDLVNTLALNYLVVDTRLGEQLPANSQYFDNDPDAGRITEPLTARQLGKFDDLPQWSRLYDNGKIRIYRVGGR